METRKRLDPLGSLHLLKDAFILQKRQLLAIDFLWRYTRTFLFRRKVLVQELKRTESSWAEPLCFYRSSRKYASPSDAGP